MVDSIVDDHPHTGTGKFGGRGVSSGFFDTREIEDRSASMVVAELGAVRFERRDVKGAANNTRDFDVVFEDGHEEPLEVTTNLDSEIVRAIDRTGGGVLELDADVRLLWMVSANETFTDAAGAAVAFDRRRVTELLPSLIEQLEREGESRLDVAALAWPIASGAPRHHRRLALELHALGVKSGGAVEIPEGSEVAPHIELGLGAGISWGPDTITDVVGDIAHRKDNVEKLRACQGSQRRHLFVALAGRGSSDMAAWPLQQLLEGDWVWERDPDVPTLPEAITTIWAGNRHGGIYATPPEGWRRFGSAKERPST
jgi:hypothetical protein